MIRRSILLASLYALTGALALGHDTETLEPPDGNQKILVGIGNNPSEATAWENAAGMFTASEKIYEVFDGLSSHLFNPPNFLNKLNNMDAQGQIPQISLFFAGFDPSFNPMDVSITLGLHDAFIDSMANTIKQYGKPVFVVPGYEFNLSGYTEYEFPKAFRYIVDRFRDVHDVDNVAWVWNPFVGGSVNTFLDKNAQGEWKWWPGARYVNWIGANGFNPTVWATKTPINSSSLAMIGLLDFADQMNKPVQISETSAQLLSDILPTSNPGAQAQANHLMQNHFGPLFTMLDCEPQMKGFYYLSTNWTNTQWPTWGDHRMQNNQFLLDQYKVEISKPRYQNAGVYNFPNPWVPYQIQKPALGGTVHFDVRNLPQGTPAVLFLAPSLSPTPITVLPYAGSFALGTPLIYVTTAMADANDSVRLSLPIPNNPAYSGLAFESQFATTKGFPKPMRVEIQ